MNIPSDLINTEWKQQTGEYAIKIIGSRFMWLSEDSFKICNEENIDCIFQMCTSDPTDCDMAKRYCKLISAVKIDNLHANTNHIDSPHLMMHPATLEPRDVLERLIRMN